MIEIVFNFEEETLKIFYKKCLIIFYSGKKAINEMKKYNK